MNKALEGIRVIDIGQLVQGPQATFNFWMLPLADSRLLWLSMRCKTKTTNLRWFLLTLYSLFSITMLSRAQVIKIELPMVGDLSRWIDCSPEDNRNAYYVACNRGKQCR